MSEIWKSLDGLVYSGFTIYGYEISSHGRIRSVDRYITMKNGSRRFHKGVMRKTKFNNRGYEIVTINVEGEEKTCLIHRLVALSFIENLDNLPEVNHKDNDKSNNRLYNLEWITSEGNHRHAVIEGFRNQSGENGVNSKLTNEEVKRIRYMYHNENYKRKDLAILFNVSMSSIGRILRRESYINI